MLFNRHRLSLIEDETKKPSFSKQETANELESRIHKAISDNEGLLKHAETHKHTSDLNRFSDNVKKLKDHATTVGMAKTFINHPEHKEHAASAVSVVSHKLAGEHAHMMDPSPSDDLRSKIDSTRERLSADSNKTKVTAKAPKDWVRGPRLLSSKEIQELNKPKKEPKREPLKTKPTGTRPRFDIETPEKPKRKSRAKLKTLEPAV